MVCGDLSPLGLEPQRVRSRLALSLRTSMLGIPGWHSGLAPTFGPGRDPGDPGSNPTRAPGAWSLLLPLPMSLPLSLSLPLINSSFSIPPKCCIMDSDCFYYLIIEFICLVLASNPSGTFSSLGCVRGEKHLYNKILGKTYTKTSTSAIIIRVAGMLLKYCLFKSVWS